MLLMAWSTVLNNNSYNPLLLHLLQPKSKTISLVGILANHIIRKIEILT